jgi:hypothetical protein
MEAFTRFLRTAAIPILEAMLIFGTFGSGLVVILCWSWGLAGSLQKGHLRERGEWLCRM